MNFAKFSIKCSAAALAVSLAATSVPALADAHMEPEVPAEESATEFPLTPEGAAQFVASVEQQYAEFSLPYAQVSWLNATYINHDSNALAAKYGAELTLMSVGFATEQALGEVLELDVAAERAGSGDRLAEKGQHVDM